MRRISPACIVFTFISSLAFGEVRLPSVFSDHMVLQRQAKVRIWGWAGAGEAVTVTFRNQKATAQAGKDGTWSVVLPPLVTGGPDELVIAGKNRIALKDVLVGEVWVGSGQSNMAMNLLGVLNSDKEIAAANFPNIRLFTVAIANANTPSDNVNGSWQICTPDSAKWFSASAYFFGRTLHKDLGVPIGLINSSVGGTAIESWIRPQDAMALKDVGVARAAKKTADEVKAAMPEYEKQRMAWEAAAYVKDPGNTGFAKGWADPEHSVADWKTMPMPEPFESRDDLDIDGVVWFRCDVDLPAGWAGRDLTLNLGPIDDCDTTYFNNTKIGGIGMETPEFWAKIRQYTVPGKLVRAGRNVIAVRVFDRWLTGGFTGGKGDVTLAPAAGKGDTPINLSGNWSYKVEWGRTQTMPPPVPRAPYVVGGNGSPGELYNAMIAPLTSFAIRGVIWYQGESNAANAKEYQSLLPAMIAGWRTQWGLGDFPFLVVQLAGFFPTAAYPTDTYWVRLREAQLLTVQKVPRTALAVAMDIGDATNIHPPNKQEVGRRLALAAEAIAYGKNIEYSGPMYKSMRVDGDKIRLTFTHLGGGLTALGGGKLTGFAIAGLDRKFVWAEARIENDQVVVWSDRVSKPVAVRYAWANNPICNLGNKTGLPAPSFRTDDF